MINIYTEFKRSNTCVVCSYCGKTLVDLEEFWSFSLFYHPKIQEMIEKDLLICNCEYAKKDKELRLEIIEYNKKIAECKGKLGNLLFLVDPLPF